MRAGLERDLLAWVAAREVTTPAQLGAKVAPGAARAGTSGPSRATCEAALRRRGVFVQPDRVDGMAVLWRC